MLVVVVGRFWRSLSHDLSLRGWFKNNLLWYKNCFKRLDMTHNSSIRKKRQLDVMAKEKCWPSLWDITDGQSVVSSGYWPKIISDEKSFFCYICIKVKYWWFDSGKGSPGFAYMKTFIGIFCNSSQRQRWLLAILITPNSMCFYTKLIYSPTMSFDHHICSCFIVCNNFNWFTEKNSQLTRFLTWYNLTVFNCA